MSPLRYSMLQDDWDVEADGSFVTPHVSGQREQMVVFADRIRNGSISADVTILKSEENEWTHQASMEATLVVRYGGQDTAYYGGTGAFGSRFFIGKVVSGPFYQPRASVGRTVSLALNKTFHLKLEFNGSQLTLYENDVQQVTMFDESYQIGQCALKTFNTSARFSNIHIEKARPRAFLIMPFASELNFVHNVLKQTVESYGIECIRADEMAIARPVMDDVKSQIASADLVLVDFTGMNPNVYYEAGLADAWKKDWIILAQRTDDLTFDVRHIRSIIYSNTMGADRVLESDLRRAIEALGYVEKSAAAT